MKRSIIISLITAVSFASCKTNTDTNANNPAGIATASVLVNGIEYRVAGVKQCNYPANDRMIEKKRNKKLVVISMQVHCIETPNKNELSPQEAELIDSRGNSYATSPAIIAIAQNNGCIKGDDIKSYNAIWSGAINKYEAKTAWVLGFEIPADAEPEKIYWSKRWIQDGHYLVIK